MRPVFIGFFGCVLFFSLTRDVLGARSTAAASFQPIKFELVLTIIAWDRTGKKQTAIMTIKQWYRAKNRARIEMTIPPGLFPQLPAGRKVITIVNGDYVYDLDESRNIARKMQVTTATSAVIGAFGMDPEAASMDPYWHRPRKGFKKTVSASKVGGHMCDVYVGKVTIGQMKSEMTTWVRQSDRFPLKFEMKGAGFFNVGEAKNIKVNPRLPNLLFVVPSGYKILDVSKTGKAELPARH